MKMLVISGLSGSGKSIALQALEDMNFYCVDNLPLGLLPSFAEQMVRTAGQRSSENIAVSIDARNVTHDLQFFEEILNELKKMGIACEVIFLEADNSTLLIRFSETRRKHPLTNPNMPLMEAITAERQLLGAIASNADLHIDTTKTNVHQLRDIIRERVAKKGILPLSMQFVSFGYKRGIPADVDFVFDTRCLPNPHWDPRLRTSNGKHPDVVSFLKQQQIVTDMYEDIKSFLERWIPKFEAENRSYMTVAVGCTGGQHRSVYLAEALASHFKKSHENVLTRHRELS
jgi:RNase adapter protein RapZ